MIDIAIYVGIGALSAAVVLGLFFLIQAIQGKRRKTSGTSGKMPSTAEKRTGYRIALRNVERPSQAWEASLSGRVLLGRSTACQISIPDKTVSRRQCSIYLNADGVLMIENISRSNKTRLNGAKFTSPCRLSRGDRLKCGAVTLLVDSDTAGASAPQKKIDGQTEFLNV